MWKGELPKPPEGFTNELKRLYPTLECKFDRKSERFCIYQPSHLSGMVPMFRVDSETDDFRYPDRRDLGAIYRADFQRKAVKQRVVEGEDYMREYRIKEEANVKSEIRDSTKDGKHQLKNMYVKAANLGKGVTGFRQVPVKPRGKVF